MKKSGLFFVLSVVSLSLLASLQQARAQAQIPAQLLEKALQQARGETPEAAPALRQFTLTSDVFDDAKLLHPQVSRQLKSIAGSNEYWTGAQFVLVITKTFKQANPQKMEVGLKGKPGVLLLVSVDEKLAWIEASPELSGVIPLNVQAAIINHIILPNFHKGDMQRGVIDGTRAVLMALQGAYTKPTPALVTDPQPQDWLSLMVLALLLTGVTTSAGGGGGYGGGARGRW